MPPDDDPVTALRKQVASLRAVAAGQAAMVAFLSTLLVKHGVITREESALVAAAGFVNRGVGTWSSAEEFSQWIQAGAEAVGDPHKP